MNSASNPLRRRLILLLALLVVLGITLAGPRQPAALNAACSAGTDNTVLVYYYSDATYTTKVGQCFHGCCESWTCSGTLTLYSKIQFREQCCSGQAC